MNNGKKVIMGIGILLFIIGILVVIFIMVITKKEDNMPIVENIEEAIREQEEKVTQINSELNDLKKKIAENTYLLSDDEMGSHLEESNKYIKEYNEKSKMKIEEEEKLNSMYKEYNIVKEN